VPIMQKELVILIARKSFPQLLEGPFSCRMFGQIEVNETSGPDLARNEYINDTEACRDRYEEITSYDSATMSPGEKVAQR
jgi:hypothetical protein